MKHGSKSRLKLKQPAKVVASPSVINPPKTENHDSKIIGALASHFKKWRPEVVAMPKENDNASEV
jgi:hypothetical protein